MSEWREIWPNGLPSAGRLPKSCHRTAAKGIQFPWRWNGGTISTNMDVNWGMSIEIANDGIGAGGLQGREGLLAIGSGHNIFHADGIQGSHQHRPRELFVVDDQYAEGTEVFGHGARSKPRKAIDPGWGFPSDSFLVRYP